MKHKTKDPSSRVLYLIYGIFALTGVILLLVSGIFTYNTISFGQNAEEISGVISRIIETRDSDGDMSHTVYVDYSYMGQSYSDVRINSYSSGMYEGKSITLLCDPDNPYHVMAKSTQYLGTIITLGMAIVFLLIGLIPLLAMQNGKNKRKKLLEQGQSIFGEVESITRNMSYSVNGRHPYVLICTYTDIYSGVTYRFKSKSLWQDPSPHLPVGSTIEIKVDRNDYSKYYVMAEEAYKSNIIDYT